MPKMHANTHVGGYERPKHTCRAEGRLLVAGGV